MAARQRRWTYSPERQPKPKVPDVVKAQVEARAGELIESVLKSEHVETPPEDASFNYVVDIYSKWFRNYFYFCAKYACPGQNAISPYFESKFARLEYTGTNSFSLSYMRHTGKWFELYAGLSLDDSLAIIKDDLHLLP